MSSDLSFKLAFCKIGDSPSWYKSHSNFTRQHLHAVMPRNRKSSLSGPPGAGSSSTAASGSSNASSRNTSPARGRGRGQRGRGGFAQAGPSRGHGRGQSGGRGRGRGRGRGSGSASPSQQNIGRGHRRSQSLFAPTSLPEAFGPLGVENPPAWAVGPSTMSELADLTALFFSSAEDIFRSALEANNNEATTETILGTQAQSALRLLQEGLGDDDEPTPGEGSSDPRGASGDPHLQCGH
ncbi:hypothetical protein PWT90_09619 [Aphanocladium album]|nr:hypothetical protein PWT90_09619 [Aphanocladium album]